MQKTKRRGGREATHNWTLHILAFFGNHGFVWWGKKLRTVYYLETSCLRWNKAASEERFTRFTKENSGQKHQNLRALTGRVVKMQVPDVTVHAPPFRPLAQWLFAAATTTLNTTPKLQVKLSCVLERTHKPIGICCHAACSLLSCNAFPVEQRLPCLLELLVPVQKETKNRTERVVWWVEVDSGQALWMLTTAC